MEANNQVFISIEADMRKDLRHRLGRMAGILGNNVQSTFNVGGARDGHRPWLVKSNPTPLIKSGLLRGSIGGGVDVESDDLSVVFVGTDVGYAKKNNEGTSIIAQREFLFFTDSDWQVIDQEFKAAGFEVAE